MYLDFHVSAFSLEITILEPKFDIFRVNRGQMLKLNILTPSDVGTGGSGGSMKRGPRAPGAPE